jgi:hypothetical protein
MARRKEPLLEVWRRSKWVLLMLLALMLLVASILGPSIPV